MEVVGRMPTQAERMDMIAPYSKNSGEEWTGAKIAEYVNAGVKRIEEDEDFSNNYAEGLRMLHGTRD